MCQVVEGPFLKSGFSSLLRRVDINIKIGSRNDLLTKHDFHDQKLTFTQCFALNPSFSFESTFSFGAIWDLFLVEHEWPQQGPTNEWAQQGPTNEWAQQGPNESPRMGPTGPNK